MTALSDLLDEVAALQHPAERLALLVDLGRTHGTDQRLAQMRVEARNALLAQGTTTRQIQTIVTQLRADLGLSPTRDDFRGYVSDAARRVAARINDSARPGVAAPAGPCDRRNQS